MTSRREETAARQGRAHGHKHTPSAPAAGCSRERAQPDLGAARKCALACGGTVLAGKGTVLVCKATVVVCKGRKALAGW